MTKAQRTQFIASLAGSAVIIAITSGVFNSFMLFLLVGKIPGTQTYLSPVQMMLFISLVTAVVLFLSFEAQYKAYVKQRTQKAKKNLPKRRLTQA